MLLYLSHVHSGGEVAVQWVFGTVVWGWNGDVVRREGTGDTEQKRQLFVQDEKGPEGVVPFFYLPSVDISVRLDFLM